MRYLSKLLRLVPVALLASPAAAAEVGPCGGLNRIDMLVGQVKSFAEGRIRVASIDTGGEAVCCAAHLLVFIPGSEPGVTQCFAVSDKAARGDPFARGFYSVDLPGATASYDPQRGLLLTVPYKLYDFQQAKPGRSATFRVRIDLRDDGAVKLER